MTNSVLAKMYRKNYAKWKSTSLEKGGYFTIFNGFLSQKYLSKISGGAMKLYIFIGISSKNETGESFYSNNSLAKYFRVSERTINNWTKELESMNLIKKMQLEPNAVAHTFLQTYQSK